MNCPNCRLENPPDSQRCDCGYDFHARRVIVAPSRPQVSTPRSQGSLSPDASARPPQQPSCIVIFGGGFILLCVGFIIVAFTRDLFTGRSPADTATSTPAAATRTAALPSSIFLSQYQCVWLPDSGEQDFRPVVTLVVKNVSSPNDKFEFKVRFFDPRGRLVDDAITVVEIPRGVERGPITISSSIRFIVSSGLSVDALKSALLSSADPNHPSHWRAELLVRDITDFGDFVPLRTTSIDLPGSH